MSGCRFLAAAHSSPLQCIVMRAPPYFRYDQLSASVSVSLIATAFFFSVIPIIALLPYSSFLLKSNHFLPRYSITAEFYKPNRYFPFSVISAGSDIIVYAAIRPLLFNHLDHGGVLHTQPLLSLFRYSGYLFIIYFCDSLSGHYQTGFFCYAIINSDSVNL